jgi:hypothetical protein
MSTYYYFLYCKTCVDATPFVSRGYLVTWMVDTEIQVLIFLVRHIDHHSALRIVSGDEWEQIQREHDIRDDWRPPVPRGEG